MPEALHFKNSRFRVSTLSDPGYFLLEHERRLNILQPLIVPKDTLDKLSTDRLYFLSWIGSMFFIDPDNGNTTFTIPKQINIAERVMPFDLLYNETNQIDSGTSKKEYFGHKVIPLYGEPTVMTQPSSEFAVRPIYLNRYNNLGTSSLPSPQYVSFGYTKPSNVRIKIPEEIDGTSIPKDIKGEKSLFLFGLRSYLNWFYLLKNEMGFMYKDEYENLLG